jgi:hypothetical protein
LTAIEIRESSLALTRLAKCTLSGALRAERFVPAPLELLGDETVSRVDCIVLLPRPPHFPAALLDLRHQGPMVRFALRQRPFGRCDGGRNPVRSDGSCHLLTNAPVDETSCKGNAVAPAGIIGTAAEVARLGTSSPPVPH